MPRPGPGQRPARDPEGDRDLPPAAARGTEALHGFEVDAAPGPADRLATAGPARGLHPGEARADPVADQLPLELPEGGDEVDRG